MSRSATDPGVRRWIVAGAASVVAAVAVLSTASGGDGDAYRVTAVVPAAVNVLEGQEVTAGAGMIGSVASVEPVDGGRAARIAVEIDDERYAPVPRDSRLAIRFGGTVSSTDRYLLLTPGEASATIADGGRLPTGSVEVPVEIDELLTTFTEDTRGEIRGMLRSTARAAELGSEDTHRALGTTGPTLRGAKALLRDLTEDLGAMRTLVRSTGKVLDAVDRSRPDIRTLLQGGARTFTAIADEADALDATLRRLPEGLRTTRSTLRQTGSTLREVDGLAAALRPAVPELRKVSKPLTRVLHRVESLVPPALDLLARDKDAKDLGDALASVTDVSPALRSIGEQATEELKCVRPYSPELALLGTTWADWMSTVDDRDHFLRATVQSFLPATFNSQPFTPGEVAKIFTDITYGFPRPPGMLADQPWYLPECGAGPDAVDPAKDGEARSFKAAQQVLPGQTADAAARKGDG